MKAVFVTDLHGKIDRYEKLFSLLEKEMPEVVFIGGDILPHTMKAHDAFDDFILDFLLPKLSELKEKLGDRYPDIFLILGNDDPKIEENKILEIERKGCLKYINEKKGFYKKFSVFGYAYIPPTPFQLKDWEKYDVSRYVDPGCTPPNEGFRSVEVSDDIIYETIKKDLDKLTEGESLSDAIFLFHSPPYNTVLDRAALDGQMVEYVPLDVHVGSIAIQRFIEDRQPLVTLHGHIHESTRLTGQWQQTIGNTLAINAAHDGQELCAVLFDLGNPKNAVRLII